MYHLCTFPFNFNRTVNGVLRDAVHRQYQGILFFLKNSQFHSSGVNVIFFLPEGKLCPNPVYGTLDVGYFSHNAIFKKVLQINTLN